MKFNLKNSFYRAKSYKKVVLILILFLSVLPVIALKQSTEKIQSNNITSTNDFQQGKTIYENKCGTCHKLFTPDKFKAKKWNYWVDKMAIKAKLTEPEKVLVKKYLIPSKK